MFRVCGVNIITKNDPKKENHFVLIAPSISSVSKKKNP